MEWSGEIKNRMEWNGKRGTESWNGIGWWYRTEWRGKEGMELYDGMEWWNRREEENSIRGWRLIDNRMVRKRIEWWENSCKRNSETCYLHVPYHAIFLHPFHCKYSMIGARWVVLTPGNLSFPLQTTQTLAQMSKYHLQCHYLNLG